MCAAGPVSSQADRSECRSQHRLCLTPQGSEVQVEGKGGGLDTGSPLLPPPAPHPFEQLALLIVCSGPGLAEVELGEPRT